MTGRKGVIGQIREAFGGNEYPGDAFLQGSFEGCEPHDEVGPFKGCEDWSAITPGLLDRHYNALTFFSEARFRYFLPAYLIADLQDHLKTGDPVFHLSHGFCDVTVEVSTPVGAFTRTIGKRALVNPRRYGAMTSYDYARYRLSVFTKEEASAIVAYLRYRREADSDGLDKDRIDAALDLFWLDRTTSAPSAARLRRHVQEEADFFAAVDRAAD
jgi:hypothetical protein